MSLFAAAATSATAATAIALPRPGKAAAPAPGALAPEGAALTLDGSLPGTGEVGFAQLLDRVSLPRTPGEIGAPVREGEGAGMDPPERTSGQAAKRMGPPAAGEAPVTSSESPSGEPAAASDDAPVEHDPVALPVPAGSAGALQATAPILAPATDLRPGPEQPVVAAVPVTTTAPALAPADQTASASGSARAEPGPAGRIAVAATAGPLGPPAVQGGRQRPSEARSTPERSAAAPLASPDALSGDGRLHAGLLAGGHPAISQIDAGLLQRSGAAPSGGAEALDIRGGQIGDHAIAHQLDLARESEWLDQLATDIARTAGKEGVLRFRLHPESLGSLEVEVSQGAAGASVRLNAETEAARAILAEAQPRLLAEARAQGVRIAETHVDIGAGGQSGPGEHRNPRQGDGPSARTPASAGNQSTDSPSGRDEAERYA